VHTAVLFCYFLRVYTLNRMTNMIVQPGRLKKEQPQQSPGKSSDAKAQQALSHRIILDLASCNPGREMLLCMMLHGAFQRQMLAQCIKTCAIFSLYNSDCSKYIVYCSRVIRVFLALVPSLPEMIPRRSISSMRRPARA